MSVSSPESTMDRLTLELRFPGEERLPEVKLLFVELIVSVMMLFSVRASPRAAKAARTASPSLENIFVYQEKN